MENQVIILKQQQRNKSRQGKNISKAMSIREIKEKIMKEGQRTTRDVERKFKTAAALRKDKKESQNTSKGNQSRHRKNFEKAIGIREIKERITKSGQRTKTEP